MDAKNPKRRWFRFSLRTLFLGLTALCCWLGYEVNWIRQRHQLLNSSNVYHSTSAKPDSFWPSFVVAPDFPQTHAPSLLWLFGEPGIASIELPIPLEQFDDSRPADSYKEIQAAKHLFPEASHIEVYPDLQSFLKTHSNPY